MAKEIKRTLKTMPDIGVTTNSPNDFFDLDFHFSYHLPETKDRIEEAVSELHVKLGKILDKDREAAGKPRGCVGTEIDHTALKDKDAKQEIKRNAGKAVDAILSVLKELGLTHIEALIATREADRQIRMSWQRMNNWALDQAHKAPIGETPKSGGN